MGEGLRNTDVEQINTNNNNKDVTNEGNIWQKTFFLCVNNLIHILSGFVIIVCLWYSSGLTSLSAMQIHIILCVLGYQFFMVEGLLLFSNDYTWTYFLPYRYKRSAHWILQVLGSVLAFGGSFYIIQSKATNFNTAHGIMGLVAVLITSIALIHGVLVMFIPLSSTFINSKWSKLGHYFTGIITMLISSICLSLGFDKYPFRLWATDNMVTGLIVITMLSTLFIFINRGIFITNRYRSLT